MLWCVTTADTPASEFELGSLFAGGFSAFERPDAALDPYLDAFGAVVQRFGIGRTRMQDIAGELGVDRTTVFRNAGPMDQIIQTYLAREVHRFFDGLLGDFPTDLDGPDLFIEVVASSIERAQAHPVLAKAIADEPDLVARLAYANLGGLIGHVREVVATGLSLLSDLGMVARVDGDVLGEWVARVGLTALVEPPPDLRHSLRTVLEPLLTV